MNCKVICGSVKRNKVIYMCVVNWKGQDYKAVAMLVFA
jgi:hypothetical protein